MTEPAVKLSGKCTLQIDTGRSNLKTEIPKQNKDGQNNADELIQEVLHFSFLRHGINKTLEMAQAKADSWDDKYREQGLIIDD